MKPIFKEERELLIRHGGIIFPENCWRDLNNVYLNLSDYYNKKPLFKIDVDFNCLYPTVFFKYKTLKYREKLKEKNYSFEEEYQMKKDIIEAKFRKSVDMTKEVLINFISYKICMSLSGGKDSDLSHYVLKQAIKELIEENETIKDIPYRKIAFNTTNESPETYKYLKQQLGLKKEDIISPDIGWYQYIKEVKNYYLPTTLSRYCCSTYKEGQFKKVYNTNEDVLIILGMRKYESHKRSFYDWYLNDAWVKHYEKLPKNKRKPLNVPLNWERFLPIVEWTDEEVWLFILHNNLEFNKMYKMGFDRCGCLICPECKQYILFLVEQYYPKMWARWENIIFENYKRYNIKKQLKWDELQYAREGHWKNFSSLEARIINNKKTNEMIEFLAYLKGCDKEVADKYWNKTCICGKKLNPKEIAMYFKLNGVTDKDQLLCKKCLCEVIKIDEDEYKEMSKYYMKQDCSLF